ncbi:hypothetical protein [Granulicella sp. dw_53]|uniref:hypothetical protein n=1 Tax=Granulicella sp. dw_53 TaxID=2719792 RepID=UPI001BD68DA7|nr:hypothetical protein [Granulicella sp. dw_53]
MSVFLTCAVRAITQVIAVVELETSAAKISRDRGTFPNAMLQRLANDGYTILFRCVAAGIEFAIFLIETKKEAAILAASLLL